MTEESRIHRVAGEVMTVNAYVVGGKEGLVVMELSIDPFSAKLAERNGRST